MLGRYLFQVSVTFQLLMTYFKLLEIANRDSLRKKSEPVPAQLCAVRLL